MEFKSNDSMLACYVKIRLIEFVQDRRISKIIFRLFKGFRRQ